MGWFVSSGKPPLPSAQCSKSYDSAYRTKANVELSHAERVWLKTRGRSDESARRFPHRGYGLRDAPRPTRRFHVFYSSLPEIGAGFRPVEAETAMRPKGSFSASTPVPSPHS